MKVGGEPSSVEMPWKAAATDSKAGRSGAETLTTISLR